MNCWRIRECSINLQLIWMQAASGVIGHAQTFTYLSRDQMFWWLKAGLREQLRNAQRGYIPHNRSPSQSWFENFLLLTCLFKSCTVLCYPITSVMELFKNLCCKPGLLRGLYWKKKSLLFMESVLTEVLFPSQYIGHYLKRSHKHYKASINNSTRV